MTSAHDHPPAVSVILPAYNASATIARAIRSVLDQDLSDLECIVVDDGSADGTAELARAAGAGDPRLIVLVQPVNAGVSEARNRALEAATGDWITFVDADDRLLPGALAAFWTSAQSLGPGVVVGQRISTDGDHSWYPTLYRKADITEPGRKSLAANPDLLYYLGPPGKLFHRSLVEDLRFAGHMIGDQPWVLRALVRAGDHVEVIGDLVYEWCRPREGEATTSITASRTRSARLGTEGVDMTAKAFTIADEAFAAAYDPATRSRLQAVYFGRLVRSELRTQLRQAIERSDPHLPPMLEALARFAGAVPASAARGSAALGDLVSPLVAGWDHLPEDAVGPAWALIRTCSRVDPHVIGSLRGGRMVHLGLRLAVAVPVLGPAVGSPVLARLARRRRAARAPGAGQADEQSRGAGPSRA